MYLLSPSILSQEVHKIKLDKRDGNNPIVFNAKSILSNLIDYSNAYIEFQFDIKFATDAACTKANLTLKNSYEMISELKIELNNRIVSNESNVNYSHIINHLLENSKNDDLIYRNIDIHAGVVKYDDTTVVSHIYTYDRAQNILNFVQPIQKLIL